MFNCSLKYLLFLANQHFYFLLTRVKIDNFRFCHQQAGAAAIDMFGDERCGCVTSRLMLHIIFEPNFRSWVFYRAPLPMKWALLFAKK